MFDVIKNLSPVAGMLGVAIFAYQAIASASSMLPQIPFGGVAVAACVLVWGVSLLAPPVIHKTAAEKPKHVKKEFKYTNISPTPSSPVSQPEEPKPKKKNKKTRRERELRKKEIEAAEAAEKAKEAKRLKKKNKKHREEDLDQGDWVTQQSTKEIIAARKASRVANQEEAEEKAGVPIVTGTVSVPPEQHYSVIGPGASNMRQIEGAFNVKISVPKKGSNDRVITIKGPEEQISNAKQCILDFAERGYSLSLMGAGAVEQPIAVNGKVIRNLISPVNGGEKLLALLEGKTNCRIFLPSRNQREQSEAANTQPMARVVGQPEAVQSTIEALSQLSDRGYSDLTHPGWVQIQMAVDASMVGVVMGRKGERIANIQKSNNVSISFPKRESRERSEENSATSAIIVTIQGVAEAVYRAQAEIARVQTSFVSMEIEFAANLLGSLRGPGGKNLAALSQMGVRINVGEHLWDPSLKVITFTGLKNDIAGAEASFRSQLARNTFEIVEVPESCLGLLIGKKGENVKRLQNSSGCHVNVREHDWDDSVKEVVISGPQSGVQQVVEEIRKMAVRPVYVDRSVVVNVDNTAGSP